MQQGDIEQVFILVFYGNVEWTGNKTPTPYGLCKLTFHFVKHFVPFLDNLRFEKFLFDTKTLHLYLRFKYVKCSVG